MNPGVVLLLAGALAGCSGSEVVIEDAVVELRYYAPDGGRPQWPSRDIARTWRTAMGCVLAARRPQGEETGVVALQLRQEGAAVRGVNPGISRDWSGACTVAAGHWIVDVFSPLNTYVVSAVAREDMPDRRLLQHLGYTRQVTSELDRFTMLREEQVHWRTFLPIVLGNDGLVWMYGRARPALGEPVDSTGSGDPERVVCKRFRIERAGDYVLVGEDQADASYRHVFTTGESYLASFVQYRQVPAAPREALAALGLVGSDSAAAPTSGP